MQGGAGEEPKPTTEEEEGSPQKRGRHQEQTLTLAMLKEVLAQEREIDRHHLSNSLERVQGDVKAMSGRVDAVEKGVTVHMERTIHMLNKVTENYDTQAKALGDLREAQLTFEKRLEALEQRPQFSSAPGSTADTEGGGNKPPALIIGGWHPDQAAEDTLQAAKDIIRRLDIQLEADDGFVPGLRRGYAILPIRARPMESEGDRRTRVQQAIQRVRNANVTTGTDDRGNMRKLWIALSQSPERRRRAKLTGKVKRTILEMGGDKTALEVEFATGTVWLSKIKVASATAERPKGAETAGVGWADITALAKALRRPLPEVRVASWNVGGLTAQHVLELTPHFAGDPDLDALQVLLLQEVITDVGVSFHEHNGWVLVYGKNQGDWRGTGIAYRGAHNKHSNTQLLPAGIATTLTAQDGRRGVRYLSGHIPHHATIAQTESILGAWKGTLSKARVVLGMDANEMFTDRDGQGWRGHTGRGEVILTAVAHTQLSTPQSLSTHTYHPYNTRMSSRRLDYVMTRGLHCTQGGVKEGSRHIARSDHDLVWVDVLRGSPPPKPRPTWGARRFADEVDPQEATRCPPTQTDTPQAIAQLAQQLTRPGKATDRYTESPALRLLRRQARGAPAHQAREAWKAVTRLRQQEVRAWHKHLVNKASQANWRAKRAFDMTQARTGWHHHLVDAEGWQEKLVGHFASIFAKAPAERTARNIADTRRALTLLCKHTPWRPFTGEDLRFATRTWKRGKAAGPDSITHELLWLLLQEPQWEWRILHMMNDFLYKGAIPESVLRGVTVLLPKTIADPVSWGDTRPITLSSSLLKWFSQLLLLRGGRRITEGAPLQWGCRGKQAPELLVVLKRVIRHAKDWGIPTWIVKLDVRKAFDSVWQESMGDMVATKAREVRVAVGDTLTHVPQTNGVRQGSPDSPVLFGRVVADDLETALKTTQGMLPPAEGPPPPQSGGAYMDDTYLWSHDKHHLQASLAALERQLRRHGLTINPAKTAIIFSMKTGGGSFHIGGEEVACQPFGTVVTALGSPITFGEEVAATISEMQHRARRAFHKHAKLLCAPTSLDSEENDAPWEKSRRVVGGVECAHAEGPMLAWKNLEWWGAYLHLRALPYG
ncbi:unnamed protein product, partial [Symbiodinium sp. CCMP2592]